jgi:hypothetical protein
MIQVSDDLFEQHLKYNNEHVYDEKIHYQHNVHYHDMVCKQHQHEIWNLMGGFVWIYVMGYEWD